MIRSKKLQWGLLTIAVGLYLYFPVWTVWHAINSNDFKHIYLGMKALLDGNSPYLIQSLHHQAALQGYRQISLNPYVYLPFTGHAMAFLAPFSLRQAVAVWFTLNHLFMAGSIYILSRMFSRWQVGAAALMFGSLAFSMPLYRTLTAGQLNLALLFLLCISWQQFHKNRHAASGVVMAFAALFKLMPGLYGLYFLLRGRWRAAGAMAATGVVLLMLSVTAAGTDIYQQFFPVLQQMGYGKSTWPHVFSFWDDPPNQSLNSFYTHIFATNDHTIPWANLGQSFANGCTIATTAALCLAYIICLMRSYKNRNLLTDDAAWCSTLLLALLIPSLMWDHYLVMLLLPVAWMVKYCLTTRRYGLIAVLLVCYILTSFPWNFEAQPWRSGAGILLMSLKLWPVLSLFGLSLCFIVWSGKDFPTGNSPTPEVDITNNAKPENTRRS